MIRLGTLTTQTVEFLSVVYSSIATVPFDEVDLALLLATSRMNNEAKGITGVLLHREGHFMQALRETFPGDGRDPDGLHGARRLARRRGNLCLRGCRRRGLRVVGAGFGRRGCG